MKSTIKTVRGLALVCLIGLTAPAARGNVLTPGDVLVSSTTDLSTGLVREYTPSGTLVQTFNVPTAPGGDPYVRGLAADENGNVQIYNGTFSPFLTTLNPAGAGSYTHHTLAGFSTVNDLNFGGVAVNGNFAYATDMATAGAGAPNGIVRFDLTTFSATRFATGSANGSGDYTTVGLGLNGLLYATWPGGSPVGYSIDVIDPTSMTVLRTLNLLGKLQLAGVVADASGNLFAVGALGDGHIYKLDSNGNILNSIATGFTDLNGLQLSNTGQLLTASSNGQVILSDTSLGSISSFSVGRQLTTFAAFVTPPQVASPGTPEPASVALLASGMLLFALRPRRAYQRSPASGGRG